MARGAFAEAASVYDADLAASPRSSALAEKRDEARERAIATKLDQANELRAAGHLEAALSQVHNALWFQTRWSLMPSPALAAQLEAEIAAADKSVDAVLRPLLAAKTPLAAKRRADKMMPLLEHPRLAPTGNRIKSQIAKAGQERCAGLSGQAQGDDQQPHLEALIASYCALFGGTAPAKASPEQRGGLRVSGSFEHASPPQQQILQAWLADVFRRTPWFSSEAPAKTPLQLAGAYGGGLERQRVTLSAPYREVVRSTVRNVFSVPTATLDTEVERVFQYDAEHYVARYDLDLTLTLELDAGAPLVARIRVKDTKQAYEHNVTHARANVYPRRANLPNMTEWLRGRLDEKVPAMVRKMAGHWSKAFCTQAQFSPDEAARCVYGGDRPATAVGALRGVFGPDVTPLLEDLARRPGEPKAKAGDKAGAAPAVEATPALEGEMI